MDCKHFFGLIGLLVIIPLSGLIKDSFIHDSGRRVIYEPVDSRIARFEGHEILAEIAVMHGSLIHQKLTVKSKDKYPSDSLCAVRYENNGLLTSWDIHKSICSSEMGSGLVGYNNQFIDRAFNFVNCYGVRNMQKLQTRFFDNGHGTITPQKIDKNF